MRQLGGIPSSSQCPAMQGQCSWRRTQGSGDRIDGAQPALSAGFFGEFGELRALGGDDPTQGGEARLARVAQLGSFRISSRSPDEAPLL